MSLTWFAAGAEQSGWRRKLDELRVEHVSLSYIGLRRRIKDPSGWRIADNFPDYQKIYLDSGCFTLNQDDKVSDDEDAAEDLAGQYYEFARTNIDRIEFASEFDALVLGQSRIRLMGETANLPDGKLMPIWHSEYGTDVLQRMAELHARVGVLQEDTDDDITPLLRKLSGQTKLHGVAMTKMKVMKDIPWDSVGSSSWLSATKWGESFVWTGREMKRYPARMKDQARKRHRSWLTDNGFDMEKIEADDSDELLKLSVWSWTKFAESIGRKAAAVDETPGTPGTELVPRAGKKLLPVMGFRTETTTDADGTDLETQVMETPSSGLLACDSCFIREKCPAMTPGSECLYEIPVKIRTARDVAALQDSMIEMQTQRVLFMRMIEQAEGGYVDANLSQEFDRLNKMIKDKNDASKEGFKLTVEASASSAEAGMLGRIFGRDELNKMGELPGGERNTQDIIDIEVIEEQ